MDLPFGSLDWWMQWCTSCEHVNDQSVKSVVSSVKFELGRPVESTHRWIELGISLFF